jgi:hypothetical protein
VTVVWSRSTATAGGEHHQEAMAPRNEVVEGDPSGSAPGPIAIQDVAGQLRTSESCAGDRDTPRSPSGRSSRAAIALSEANCGTSMVLVCAALGRTAYGWSCRYPCCWSSRTASCWRSVRNRSRALRSRSSASAACSRRRTAISCRCSMSSRRALLTSALTSSMGPAGAAPLQPNAIGTRSTSPSGCLGSASWTDGSQAAMRLASIRPTARPGGHHRHRVEGSCVPAGFSAAHRSRCPVRIMPVSSTGPACCPHPLAAADLERLVDLDEADGVGPHTGDERPDDGR